MRQLTKIILAILILLCFGIPGYASGNEHRVVFMGNSITEGWSNADPAFFSGKPYINSGISGQTTTQMLERFERDVINFLPTVVVILAGTNDIAGNGGATTVKRIHANIASMAQLAKTNGIKVVLCSVLPVYKYPWSQSVNPIDSISSLNNLIKTYAQGNEMIYADFYSPMVNEQKGLKSQYSSDGVHPNLAGYKVMDPIVEEAIEKAFILAGINQLKDLTDEPGTITAQGENQPDIKGKAFDNDATTKWFDLANANPGTRESWIQYQLSGNSYIATQYTITSANDFPDRDPKNWELLGSDNGSDWTSLDIRTNEEFSSRLLKKSYSFNNSTSYTNYRLKINSVNNPTTATGVQLGELEILGVPVVSSVSLLPTVLNLDKNDARQLYARVSPSNATATVIWSSSNEAVATVSSSGLVTARSAGNATITATSANNNKTAICSVTVYNSGFTKFEAENATLGGPGAPHLVKDQQGYSGAGFAAPFGNNGDYVQFSITGATAGSQYITLRYAAADGAKIHLYVNGTMIRQVTLGSTGCWGCWTDKEDEVTLNSGDNTIRYKQDTGDRGHMNIDYLAVRNIQTGITDTPEGENDILLFPNPLLSGGLLTVKLPEDAIQLSIFDISGRKVYQEDVMNNEFLMDHSMFKSEGIYIVNVITGKGSKNQRLIVTK